MKTSHKHAVLVMVVIVTITILGIVTISQGATLTTRTTLHSVDTMYSTTTGYFGFTTTMKSTLFTTTTVTASITSERTSKSSSSTSSALTSSKSGKESIITKSASQSSQWLVLGETTSPIEVSANDTGVIPPYSTLASLNRTTIGEECVYTVDSSCETWKFVSQTGWFFDSVSLLLYVHYQGAPAVDIVVTN